MTTGDYLIVLVYRHLLTTAFTWKNSEIHSKNIEIYLSKLYIGTYYEVHNLLIKYIQKTLHLLIVLTSDGLLIMSRMLAVFCLFKETQKEQLDVLSSKTRLYVS